MSGDRCARHRRRVGCEPEGEEVSRMPIKTPDQIDADARRLLGAGVERAGYFFKGIVQQVLSVPAPRRKVASRAGHHYIRTATPATPGEPPRKLTGRLRASVAMEFNRSENVARVGSNVIYARVHEAGNHPFLLPTLQQYLSQIVGIIRG